MNIERELHNALVREPAPPSIGLKVMARLRSEERRRGRLVINRIAATVAFVSLLGVAGARFAEERAERREGEAARQQVLLALRITTEKTTLAKHAIQHGTAE